MWKIFIGMAFFVFLNSCTENLNLDKDPVGDNDTDTPEDQNDDNSEEDGNNPPNQRQEVVNPDIKKAYWKIYKNEEEPAEDNICYFLPRPDGVLEDQDVCDTQHEFYENYAKYDLCAINVRPPIINKIPCSFAIQVSTELHKYLKFGEDGLYIPLDLKVEACAQSACKDNAALDRYCRYYQDRYDRSQAGEPIEEIGRVDSEEEKTAIAVCVNALFQL